MSHDLTVTCVECLHPHSLIEQEYTYNYQPVFAMAGLESIGLLDGMEPSKARETVASVLAAIEAAGVQKVNAIVRGGGSWGRYEYLVPNLRELLEALNDSGSFVVEVR